MGNSFDASSSVKHLEWLTQYRKLSSRNPQDLTPQELKTLKDLEEKLSRMAQIQKGQAPESKRKAIRIPIALEADIKSATDFSRVYIKNISGGGLYIETPTPKPMGSRCQLNLKLPHMDKPLLIEVEVAWISTKAIGPLGPGMGVKFTDLKDADRKQIQKIIDESLDTRLKVEKPK